MIALFHVILCLSVKYAFCGYMDVEKTFLRRECLNKTCDYAAIEYLSSINKFINPCDDFYSYVCSGFMSKSPFHPLRDYWDQFAITERHLRNQLSHTFETSKPESLTEIKAFNLYKGCMEINATETNNMKTLREMLKQVGGWPILGDQLDKKYYWLDAVATAYKKFDVEILLNLDYTYSYRWHKKIPYTVMLIKASRKIDLIRTENKKVIDFYKSLINSTVEYLNSSNDEETIKKDIDDIVALDRELATWNYTERSIEKLHLDGYYFRTALWSQFYAYVNITPFFWEIYDGKVNIDNVDSVWVDDLFRITGTIRAFEYKSFKDRGRMAANYIGWRIVRDYIGFAASPLREKYDDFLVMNNLITKRRKQENFCASVVEKYLPYAVNSLFKNLWFRPEYKRHVEIIANEIKNVFIQTVKESTWLDSVIRRHAERKLNHMKIEVAFPDRMLNNTEIDNYYQELENITEENPLLSVVHARKFHQRKMLTRIITKFKDRKPLEVNPSSVSINYTNFHNILTIGGGSMLFPMFYNNSISSMNFGALGVIIASEIGRALDLYGIQLDENATFYYDLLTEEISAIISEKYKCFFDHYSLFVEPLTGEKINTAKSVNEDILDNEAIRITYKAYKNYVSKYEAENESKLSTVPFNPDQLFFISHAYSLCQSYSLKFLKTFYKGDRSLNRIRVLGSLSNSQEFFDAFGCTVNNDMYRKNTSLCRYW